MDLNVNGINITNAANLAQKPADKEASAVQEENSGKTEEMLISGMDALASMNRGNINANPPLVLFCLMKFKL